MEERHLQTTLLVPPDGGYGWVIVLSSILQHWCVIPTMPMFGLIFGSKFSEFQTTPTEKTSIFAAFVLSWNLTTMFVGPLVQLRSERFVAFCGTSFTITGLLICAFSTNTFSLAVGYGLVFGIGIGLVGTNGILIISKYFREKIVLAFSLFASAVGIASLVLPQLIKLLLFKFSGQQVILIYAVLSCVGYVGAILMLDVNPFMKKIPNDDFEPLQTKPLKENVWDEPKREKIQEEENSCFHQMLIIRVLCMIKWKLLSNPYFLMISLGTSLLHCSLMFYVSSIRTISAERGLNVPDTADIISVIAFSDILTRLFQGVLGGAGFVQKRFTNPKKSILTIMGLGLSASLITVAYASDFVSLAVCVCLCSLFISGILINGPIVYGELFPENLSSALGLSDMIKGLLATLLGPATGLLNSYFGSFNAALYLLSGATFSFMILWLLVDLLHACRK